MTIIEAIILGIVQGITEFLPVSSSGHLVLLGNLFNIGGDFIFFSVAVHFATLLAVLIYFKKDILFLIKNPFCAQAKKLYIATLPTVIMALLFMGLIEDSFSGSLLPFCFMFTAVLLFITQLVSNKKNTYKSLTNKGSLIMGIMQGVAILPGISRSGTTICTGIILGYDRMETANFSFLMSVPIIFASMCYEIIKLIINKGALIYPLQTVLASIIAFAFGLVSIKFMLWIVKKIKFYWFSLYLIILSAVSLIFL